MSDPTPCDVAVVGAGLVGLATAMALQEQAREHGRETPRVIVLDSEDRVAAHQSGHNSGVIHSGLYYPPGSLKARLCVEGREAMFAFCAAHGIAHARCGKLVVAVRPDELPRLDALEARGRANGLAVRRLGPADIAGVEPHAVGLAALWVPETGVVDYRDVARAMARVVAERGGEVRLGGCVTALSHTGDGVVVTTTSGTITARCLVACAGLQADRVAALGGVPTGGVRIVPFRGAYHRLVGPSADLVRHLIYPVPDPRFPFLGVHFTRGIDGAVHVGPDATLALARHGYRRGAFVPRDAAAALLSPAVWRLSARYWRIGAGEIVRSWSRRRLARALQAMVPGVRAVDLVPAGAGVRAQALEPSGALVDDFRIVAAPRMIHVLNAPSPAATASIAIGRHIAAQAVDHLGLA